MLLKRYALMFLMLASCGGSLTDEQRKEMHRKMEANQIVRITEVEITEAAYTQGRRLITTLDSLKTHPDQLDSFLKSHGGAIRFITSDTEDARPLEKQLLQAYHADSSGSMQDNVQKLRNEQGGFDSVLYTKPETKSSADNDETLAGVWNIWLSKKDLVMAISAKK